MAEAAALHLVVAHLGDELRRTAAPRARPLPSGSAPRSGGRSSPRAAARLRGDLVVVRAPQRPSRRSRARRRRRRGRAAASRASRGCCFQRTPTTTQSAVFSSLTLTTASRAPGSRRARAAWRPRRRARAPRSGRATRSRPGSVVAGESQKPVPRLAARRGAARAAAVDRLRPPRGARRRRRRSPGSRRTACGRGSRRDAAASASRRSRARRRGRSRSRRRAPSAAAADRRAAAAPGSSGAAVARCATRAQLAAVVLEHAAKAVPLRLVLPALADGQLADELGLHRRERDVGTAGREAAAMGCSTAREGGARERCDAEAVPRPTSGSTCGGETALGQCTRWSSSGLDAGRSAACRRPRRARPSLRRRWRRVRAAARRRRPSRCKASIAD